jgi:hypothetical protein
MLGIPYIIYKCGIAEKSGYKFSVSIYYFIYWCQSKFFIYEEKVLDWKFKNSSYIFPIWLAKKENIGSQPQNISCSYHCYIYKTFWLVVSVWFAFVYENLEHRQWYAYHHSLDAGAIENSWNW